MTTPLSAGAGGPSDEELLEWAADSDDIPPEFLDPDSGRWERCFS